MKKILLIISILVLFYSCKKGDENPIPVIPPPEDARIKTMSSGGSVLQNFEYDTQKRQTKLTLGNGQNRMTISYGTGTVTENEYGSGGTISLISNLLLNADGLVETITRPQYPAILIKYEYNTDKTPSKKTIYNNSLVTNITLYFYQDGNMVKDSSVNYPSLGYTTNQYEYYTDVISTLDNVNYGLSYYGKANKNYIKKVTTYTGGVQGTVVQYDKPELDAQKRIIKTGSQSNTTPGVKTERQFTYQ
jgi:hypothetical protein